jgi:hypothetical protein
MPCCKLKMIVVSSWGMLACGDYLLEEVCARMVPVFLGRREAA